MSMTDIDGVYGNLGDKPIGRQPMQGDKSDDCATRVGQVGDRAIIMGVELRLYLSYSSNQLTNTLFTLDLYSNTRPAFGLHISQNT